MTGFEEVRREAEIREDLALFLGESLAENNPGIFDALVKILEVNSILFFNLEGGGPYSFVCGLLQYPGVLNKLFWIGPVFKEDKYKTISFRPFKGLADPGRQFKTIEEKIGYKMMQKSLFNRFLK